jgi:hypothetical protein
MAAHVIDRLPEGDDCMYEVKFNEYPQQFVGLSHVLQCEVD